MLLNRYRERAALGEHPGYLEAMSLHRRAALEQASVLLFKARPEPKLDTPFGA